MRLGADGADAEVPADAGAAVRGVDRAARTAAQPAGRDGAQAPRCAERTVPQGDAVEGIEGECMGEYHNFVWRT